MSKHVALYAHLTRTGQTLEAQMRDLVDLACQSGCEIIATLTDETLGEKDNAKSRFEFDRLLNTARPDVDVVRGWTVDRLGRSLQHVVITPTNETLIAY
jgi:DNA invertase Pin-like site-specific DNA recombinase